jgi:hypothetical protein
MAAAEVCREWRIGCSFTSTRLAAAHSSFQGGDQLPRELKIEATDDIAQLTAGANWPIGKAI